MFDQDMQAEMFKNMVTKSAADGATDGIIQSFNNRAGEAFVEVIQEFIPPKF